MQVINKHKTIIPLQAPMLDAGWTYVSPQGRAQDLNPLVSERYKGLQQEPAEQQPLGMNKSRPWLQSSRTKELAHDETGLQTNEVDSFEAFPIIYTP